ncbi:site-specific DNA-methyltransferase [Kangiella sp. TOML190]|uniref:site-specific DNA-methyltransferase n=1 Tax=Kangiella sp. TOML190 TaxID=2931351 RepID=UPI00203E3BE1|nr:site-specific DNA-methyltransferase [Kangiella sp. TOML190]
MPLLQWLDDDKARVKASQVPYRLLEEQTKLSYGDPYTENMLIQGDNLDALKALLPYYAGKVKCIFIDPPYNTKSAFEHYDDNLEHSQWLNMMYPRLELLRELLAEDGSIWVTLDDNEAHYCKVIMDEVFGRSNYLGDFVWRKRKGGGNDSRYFAIDHDYAIGYAKKRDKNVHKLKWRVPYDDDYLKRYKEIDDNGLRYYWDTLSRKSLQNPIVFEIDCPDGSSLKVYSQKSKEVVLEMLKQGSVRLVKNKKNEWTIHHRVYQPKDGKVLRSFLYDVGTNKAAKDEQIALGIEEDDFDYPKPENLIRTILSLHTNMNDLILDSFLGSGTTAAVAHKMHRRYIGIELGEHAKTHCQPRLQKVVDGEQGGISKAVDWQGGGGFRFYQLGETVFDEEGLINANIKFAPLAAHIWFAETGKPMTNPANPKSPLLGFEGEKTYFLLYNGVLGDKKPQNGNVLTRAILKQLLDTLKHEAPDFNGEWVVYGESCRIGQAKLEQHNITFKQTPYDIKA